MDACCTTNPTPPASQHFVTHLLLPMPNQQYPSTTVPVTLAITVDVAAAVPALQSAAASQP
jgi:hypothetical protein